MSMDAAQLSRFVRAIHTEGPTGFHWVSRDIVIFQAFGAMHVLVQMEDHNWNCDCNYAELTGSPCCHVRILEGWLDVHRNPSFSEAREHCGQLARPFAPIAKGVDSIHNQIGR